MKLSDIKLICIESEDNIWTVYVDKMPGIVVEVKDLKDAPKEIARSFECFLKYGFDEKIHKIVTKEDYDKFNSKK